MPKILFKFDKERDLQNIWETCNFKTDWSVVKKGIDPEIVQICQSKKFEDCKKEIEAHYSKIYDSGFIEVFLDSLNKAWVKINDKFFKCLEKIMKKPICSETFVAYITTVGRCPYDPNRKFFMVSLFYPLLHALKTCGHEIMHLQFHNTYWNGVEKEIGKEKTSDLKEALTVLLNLEFKDLWFVQDKGYEPHKKLRRFIQEEWKKKKDFDILIKKCIEYLK